MRQQEPRGSSSPRELKSALGAAPGTPGHAAGRAMLVSGTANRRGDCPCLSVHRNLLLLQASLSLQNVTDVADAGKWICQFS